MAFGPKTRKFLVGFLILGWSLTLGFAFFGKGQVKRIYRDNRVLMGTFWEVSSDDKEAPQIVFQEAGRIEQLLSKYIPESEVSRLNSTGRIKASPDTFYIIKKSLELNASTQGAFDITVGPLVDLWGFTGRRFRVPEPEEIKKTLELCGSDKIVLHQNDNVIEFKIPGAKIDLGGIAKGYALDCAVRKLKAKGIKNCLINAGGQVYCLGTNQGKPWKIALQAARENRIFRVIELKNRSASTSADNQQYFIIAGKRYSHIIDPRTGYPALSGVASVTIISYSGLEADALSTAFFILGKDKGIALLTKFKNSKLEFYQ